MTPMNHPYGRNRLTLRLPVTLIGLYWKTGSHFGEDYLTNGCLTIPEGGSSNLRYR